jgi:hypothetical protein
MFRRQDTLIVHHDTDVEESTLISLHYSLAQVNRGILEGSPAIVLLE